MRENDRQHEQSLGLLRDAIERTQRALEKSRVLLLRLSASVTLTDEFRRDRMSREEKRRSGQDAPPLA